MKTSTLRRAFESALEALHALAPALLDGVDVRLCPARFWPPDAPQGAVGVFDVGMGAVVVLERPGAAVTDYVATLAHEAWHRRQFLEAGAPAGWTASEQDEVEAEAAGRALAALASRHCQQPCV